MRILSMVFVEELFCFVLLCGSWDAAGLISQSNTLGQRGACTPSRERTERAGEPAGRARL